jgi:hypothetical protein
LVKAVQTIKSPGPTTTPDLSQIHSYDHTGNIPEHHTTETAGRKTYRTAQVATPRKNKICPKQLDGTELAHREIPAEMKTFKVGTCHHHVNLK